MSIIEVFQGHSIAIRSDGYWNGSALCNTEGRQIEAFLSEDSVKRYLEALSEDLNIPVISVVENDYQGEPTSLIHCIEQGEGRRWEIWTHEEVALKLTGWLNPKLEIWFHRTIKKLLKEGQVRLEDEIDGLKAALSQSQEQLEETVNELALSGYRNDQLRYERDELSELAQWRKENSFTGRDS